MYEARDAVLPRSFQQNMRSIYVCVRELVGIAETEINVRLCSKVENGVDLVLAQHSLHIRGRSDVALFEREVAATVENAGVIKCRAVVEFIERYNVVVLGVRKSQVSDKPTCAMGLSVATLLSTHTVSHMKPAPPVTRMLRASSRGSKRVDPVKIGACCQISSVR